MEQDDTGRLIEKIHQGNTAGFNFLFGRYRTRILTWIRYRLDRSLSRRLDPEDILQEVYLRAYRELPTTVFDGDRVFLKWILAIADNCTRDARRHHLECKKRSLRKEVHLGAASDPRSHEPLKPFTGNRETDTTPSKIFERESQLAELIEIVQQLPPLQRDAIMMVRIGGQTVSRVARELQQSPQAVSLALIRGFAAVRKLVRRKRGKAPYLAEEDPGESGGGECNARADARPPSDATPSPSPRRAGRRPRPAVRP